MIRSYAISLLVLNWEIYADSESKLSHPVPSRKAPSHRKTRSAFCSAMLIVLTPNEQHLSKKELNCRTAQRLASGFTSSKYSGDRRGKVQPENGKCVQYRKSDCFLPLEAASGFAEMRHRCLDLRHALEIILIHFNCYALHDLLESQDDATAALPAHNHAL